MFLVVFIYHRCWPLLSEELAYSRSSSGESERLWTLQLNYNSRGVLPLTVKEHCRTIWEEFERAHPVSSSSLSGNGSVGSGSALGGGITSMEQLLWRVFGFWHCIVQTTHVSAHPSPWRDNAEIPSDVPARSSTEVECCINTEEKNNLCEPF